LSYGHQGLSILARDPSKSTDFCRP